MRTDARPDPSVVANAEVARISGVVPVGDVMNRKSPDTASNRTSRPARATPAWESVTETSASPPEQSVPAGQPELCVEDGVIRMSLLIVPGFTVTVAVAIGAVPVSRTLIVTVVSAGTGLATTVIEVALREAESTGNTRGCSRRRCTRRCRRRG
jgi:hypothetical protein